MNEQDLNKLFAEWLKEHNATIIVTAQAPTGAQIEISSFIPKQLLDGGWRAVLNVFPVEDKK